MNFSADNRMYIAIDLKSFYASVECVERGLDPFTTNLVVADPTRSKSTICLAITPAMKKAGVKNRCRIHEIPPGISYITAPPRMQLYIDYSASIYAIYLRYVSPDDIHVYSIDECFLDVTEYLSLYQTDALQLARELMQAVFSDTGICATAGIGTNLYLAKIAMDLIAKHAPDHIGYLDEYSYREKLWSHTPLTDFWQIGSGKARTLARYGIYTMGDLARISCENENKLFSLFGIDAELLIDHAWGIETCTMADIKHYHTRQHSLSSSQVLMRNYNSREGRVIFIEMADDLILDLVRKKVSTTSAAAWISYDHRLMVPSGGGSVRFPFPTNSRMQILPAVTALYDRIVCPNAGIRRLCITFNQVRPDSFLQYDLFTDPLELDRERSLQEAVLSVRSRYGKNALQKGTSLLSCSTILERNTQIGGHRAGEDRKEDHDHLQLHAHAAVPDKPAQDP